MDAFESEWQKQEQMNEEQRKKETERLGMNCICPDCPTYNKCAVDRQEVLFCFKGKTDCISDELGCICADCPVAAELDLVNLYYCTRGSEREMR